MYHSCQELSSKCQKYTQVEFHGEYSGKEYLHYFLLRNLN